MNDTCVMCANCFNANDHQGHDTARVPNEEDGACCDCGDSEAWKCNLICCYHDTHEELAKAGKKAIINQANFPIISGYGSDECPTLIAESIRETISVLLEFILETLSTAQTVQKSEYIDEKWIIDDMKKTSKVIGQKDDESLYALVLWNDEDHESHAINNLCKRVFGCNEPDAKRIAEDVIKLGRDVVKVSDDILLLVDMARQVIKESFYPLIRSARDVFREQLAGSIFLLLKDISRGSYQQLARLCQGNVIERLRYEISRELNAPWIKPRHDDKFASILSKMLHPSGNDEDDVNDGNPMTDRYHSDDQSLSNQEQYRSRRRLRSESSDSLRRHGDERGNPRNNPLLNLYPSDSKARDYTQSNLHTNSNMITDCKVAAESTQKASKLLNAQFSEPNGEMTGFIPTSEQIYTDDDDDDNSDGTDMDSGIESDAFSGFLDEVADEVKTYTRLDWLMLFDLTLWNVVRNGIHDLHLATVMKDPDYKLRFAITFTHHYQTICRQFLYKDKSAQYSIFRFSTHIFPSQSIASILIKQYRILHSIIKFLHGLFNEPIPIELQTPGFMLSNTPIFRNRRSFQIFIDIRHLVDIPAMDDWISNQ